ncbi:MAG: RNA 2',3'-cyclic phosphodiesterase [Planctomycetota bacterium]
MRLFVAAELPREVRERLVAIRRELEDIPLRVRWVREEGLHLTLKFLGEVAADRLGEIESALPPAGRSTAPFRLEAKGVGAFPEAGTPRVIWVGLRGGVEAAGRLAAALEDALEPLGFARESRSFRPHLTIGRVKGSRPGDWRAGLLRVSGAGAGEFEVKEFILFRSRLGPGGASYEALARFPIASRPEV